MINKLRKLLMTPHDEWEYSEERRKNMITSIVCILLIFLVLIPVNMSGATFPVLNINDTGTNSLRWAITQANNNLGFDNITFNISGVGPHTIMLQSQLPILSDSAGVFIDGFSEPGSSAGSNPPSTATLMIEVNGMNAGAAHGFWIFNTTYAQNNTIQGLIINNFEQDGIRIQGTPIGTFNNTVYSNFIGTDPTGTIQQGNGTNMAMLWAGVNILCPPGPVDFNHDNIVDGNLIADNYAEGVSISNCPPSDVYLNAVLNNYIGTDITGSIDFGNVHDGVYIGEGAHDNIVDGNLISGNDFEGVCIVGYAEQGWNSHSNIVFNNIIGLDINLNPLGNTMDGVSIGQYDNSYQGGYATDNVIDSNTIAHNGDNGVTVWEHSLSSTNADRNQITRNSIYNNNLLGIDLVDNGVTLNDPGDTDFSANQELNFPVIASANYSGGQTTISGTIDIDTNPNQAIVEVFQAIPDPTNYGEGAVYLGFTQPDGAGNWNIIVTSLVSGDDVTATTTDMNFNTSEFCANVTVIDVGVEEDFDAEPTSYVLGQNIPNPFSDKTHIRWQIPEGVGSRQKLVVCIKIYDVSGKLIKSFNQLTSHQSPINYVVWNGTDDKGNEVRPGVYFYRLETADFNATRKMILMR